MSSYYFQAKSHDVHYYRKRLFELDICTKKKIKKLKDISFMKSL